MSVLLLIPLNEALVMAIRFVRFQMVGIKLERFLHKNQHTQRKLLNFENWTNGEPQ